ncbi:MAG: phage major capsid protein [Gemmatimonadota bacterium]|nr:phage major capsid protein [Gemmatimonadota bacterium]
MAEKSEEKRKAEVFYRDMPFVVDREKLASLAATRAAGGIAEERIPIAISSESPVRRYSWWDGEFYDEVLVHTKEAVDLSYARDGMPFLDGHDTRQQEAIVEDITLDKDGILRGMVRFSQRQTAQDLKRDMLDGIRKKISVGYRCLETETREVEGDNSVDEVRVTRWLPMEASSVAIPADYSVGVGRSAGDALPEDAETAITALRKHFPHLTITAPKATARSITMPEANTAAENNGAKPAITVADRDEAVKAERKRVSEIRSLATKHKIPAEKVEKWVEEGRSVESAAASILGELQDRGDAGGPTGRPAVELTDKERKQYSFQRAILMHSDDVLGKRVDGSFEREIAQELEKKVPEGVKRHGGFLVPTFTSTESAREIMARQNGWPMATRAGLDASTATKGQELKFTVPGDFLELLRNQMVAFAAGVQLYAGLQGPVAFPAQNGAATATWVGENPGADVADSNLTLTQIALNPKSIQASTSYSRQLLAQAVVDVDSIVRADLARVNAIALDLAVFAGTGAANQPTGILNTGGIGSVALGANGVTPVYTNLVDLETQVAAANADQWPCSYAVHPTTRGTLKKATVLGNTVGIPVWQKGDANYLGSGAVQGMSARVPGELNGYPAHCSAQIPNNLTKGTSVGICLAIIFGAFSQAVVGDWGMMELIVDPYRLKKQGMIEVTSFAMYGIAVKYAAAFAEIKDALA